MKYHFIAIGGAAMHNLAIALKIAGHEVTGSDDEIFEPSRSRLEEHKLLPEEEGWWPERIHCGIDAIILGMHAKADNPELARARELNLPIHSFPSFLYDHSKDKQRIVIGGSHGKTTITSMIIHVLRKLGYRFDYMVGALVEGFDVMVRLSDDSPVMILEGDEYLTSALDPRPKFHLYMPHIAVLSGIAWDHMNVFPTFPEYVDQFRKFITMIPGDGKLFYTSGDEELEELVREFPDLETIRYNPHPFKTGQDGRLSLKSGDQLVRASFFGRHNMLNAEAAALVCETLGVSRQEFVLALADFRGAGNRLELMHSDDDFAIYRDFAHAPSKVRATVQAMRERYPERHIYAVLELHTYSSLNKAFLPQYKETLDCSDDALVYMNPHAFKLKKLPMINPDEVMKQFAHPSLRVAASSEEVQDYFQEKREKGQVWLFMSSGNFGGIELKELT